VVAVTALGDVSKQRGITFQMLSDVGSETIKRYGILNTVAMELTGPNAKDPALTDDTKTYVSVVGANPRMAGIAFPGTFILDRSGRVKSRFFEDFYITRNTVSSILARTGTGDPVAGTKISTDHLDVTAYPSDAAIAPGNRITLTFDIAPHRGIHVYAPGRIELPPISSGARGAVSRAGRPRVGGRTLRPAANVGVQTPCAVPGPDGHVMELAEP
jgi:hypothetical protein